MRKRIFGIMEKGILMRRQKEMKNRRRLKIEEAEILYIEYETGQ